tara:strand:- start:228 stop:422 length:195 start_codon:yes stop_codon:yes gene_type:complete
MTNTNKISEKSLSPCVGICQLNTSLDLCLGCFRSSKEIALWSSYSKDEKKMVLKSINKRKKLVY